MNKKLILGACFTVIIIVLAGLFSSRSKQSPANITQTIQEAQPSTDPNSLNSENQRYIEFQNGILEKTLQTKRVLYFYANWCPTCIPADKAFQASTAQIPEDVTIIRVNYNDPDTDNAEKDLARKYGITYQHTFVQIDNDGNEVTKWNGGSLTELMENIK